MIEAMNAYDLTEGLILTLDGEEELTVDGLTIRVKPVWKWLLGN